MIRFKKGDRVIRVKNNNAMPIGTKCTVFRIGGLGATREFLVLKGDSYPKIYGIYATEYFKLLLTCKATV